VGGIWEGGKREERVIYLLARNTIKRMVRGWVCGVNHCTWAWNSYPGVDSEFIGAGGGVCAIFCFPLATCKNGIV
jgi:hypothetical protein